MPTKSFDKESIKASIIGKLQRYNGRTIAEASNAQIYRALASTVRDQIMQKWMISREERKTNNNKRPGRIIPAHTPASPALPHHPEYLTHRKV